MTAPEPSSSASGNGRDTDVEASVDLERLYVGAFLATGDPPAPALSPADLTEPRCATLLGVLLHRRGSGHPIDAASLVASLSEDVLTACGGAVFLAELLDAASEWPASLAARVAEAAREIRARAGMHARLRAAEELADARADPSKVRRSLERALELVAEPAPAASTLDVGDLALDLAAIRARPRGASPLPGLLPDEPALVVLVARPKAGKTRLATSIAQAAAAGVAPWPGPPDRAPALELGRVAVVTAEETAADMVRMLDGLELLAQPQRARERWQERLRLYARDPSLDSRVEPILRLDSDGFALLRRLARACGLVVVDSLSRIKPPAVEEIDNDAMTALLDELHRIATEERAYVLLLHHEGHADRDDPVSAGRGASAISAVARAVWHLDRVAGDPHRRRLRVRGNAVADAELTLEVSGPDAQPEGAVLYWRPVDPLGGVALEDVLPEVGSECSTRDLARHLSGCDADEEPSGRTRREAALIRDRWRREGLVEVVPGPRRSQLLRRVR